MYLSLSAVSICAIFWLVPQLLPDAFTDVGKIWISVQTLKCVMLFFLQRDSVGFLKM